jgi:co-chaperonin GroES (HSP10)
MNSLKDFIVFVPQRLNDKIVVNGLELYVDPKYDEFSHRKTSGEVVAVPLKYNTGVKEGDTIYFHHHVVINGGQKMQYGEDLYLVRYSDTRATENQAIAHKSKDTGEVKPMKGWSLLTPYMEEAPKLSEIIETVELTERPYLNGIVAFDSEDLQDMGVKKGDIVGFKKNHDYEVDIDGEKYFRVRTEDLLYVKEQV